MRRRVGDTIEDSPEQPCAELALSASHVHGSGVTAVERAARTHGAELLSFLRRRASTPEDAADIRQDVLVRVLTAPAVGPIQDVRAYLFQIARRLLIDRRRRAQLETEIFDEGADTADEACTAPSPERAVASATAIERLQEAVTDLPERLRLALLWNRLDGLTLKEVGARLGVSESMASRYVNEALAHCSRRIKSAKGVA